MTTIHADAHTRVLNISELKPLFTGNAEAGHIGTESEFFIYTETGRMAPPTAIARISDEMAAHKHTTQTEACGVLEITSEPHRIEDLDGLYHQSRKAEFDLTRIATDYGLSILPVSVPPFTTLQAAESEVIPRQRIQDMIASTKRLLPRDALSVGLLTASCQVSIDYQDESDLYKKLHRGHAITPLLMTLFSTDTGRIEGIRRPSPIRADLYRAYGDAQAGVPAYFKQAATPTQLIDAHLSHVANTPLLYHYKGEDVVYPASLSETFNSLSRQGEGTVRNFEVAESFLYHDIKFKPLPNGKRRLEFRTADTGFGHAEKLSALIKTLVADERTATRFDALLVDFGFKGNLAEDHDMFVVNRTSALNPFEHREDIRFGNKTLEALKDSIRKSILPHIPDTDKTGAIMQDLFKPDRYSLGCTFRGMSNNQLHAYLFQPAHREAKII